jgi:23S rRNA pseudouridine2605 synthase
MEIRLNKFLSENGVCSRRSADTLIEGGHVKVNGVVAKIGSKIDSQSDTILVNNKKVELRADKVYYVLNKPIGYVTTSSDPFGRKKVTDLVPKDPRVYPVGRLDYDTSGLLILTNDGDLTNKLTHPKFEKEKEYAIVAKATKKCPIINAQCPIGKSLSEAFLKGIRLKEGIAKADKIKMIEEKGDTIKFNITLHQGWNRQIRRMCEGFGLQVLSLKRIRLGGIVLGNIKEGKWRILSETDLKKI